jgi:hypothetical protein
MKLRGPREPNPPPPHGPTPFTTHTCSSFDPDQPSTEYPDTDEEVGFPVHHSTRQHPDQTAPPAFIYFISPLYALANTPENFDKSQFSKGDTSGGTAQKPREKINQGEFVRNKIRTMANLLLEKNRGKTGQCITCNSKDNRASSDAIQGIAKKMNRLRTSCLEARILSLCARESCCKCLHSLFPVMTLHITQDIQELAHAYLLWGRNKSDLSGKTTFDMQWLSLHFKKQEIWILQDSFSGSGHAELQETLIKRDTGTLEECETEEPPSVNTIKITMSVFELPQSLPPRITSEDPTTLLR